MTALFNFRIDPETRKRFHIWCIENETTIADKLRSYIADELDRSSSKLMTQRKNPTSQDKDNWRKDLVSENSFWEDRLNDLA